MNSIKIERKIAGKSPSQPWCTHSNAIYDVQLQKTIELRVQTQHQGTLMQQFQCAKKLCSCEVALHSVNRKAKKSPQDVIPNACAVRAGFRANPTVAATVAQASLLFSDQWRLFTQTKTQCFVQLSTFKSHPWYCSSIAICRQRVAKHYRITKEIWRTSNRLLYLMLFYASFNSTQFYSTLFCSTLR